MRNKSNKTLFVLGHFSTLWEYQDDLPFWSRSKMPRTKMQPLCFESHHFVGLREQFKAIQFMHLNNKPDNMSNLIKPGATTTTNLAIAVHHSAFGSK